MYKKNGGILKTLLGFVNSQNIFLLLKTDVPSLTF